ncbi:hypothetical protein CBR_g17140 [Chara braunii]|uniref:Uncharacterized protein n=1 Tax=Chara braunii TaxID=69332 RepID=A0A388KUS2_CHABU|nr:hypothetical protein CBR_g17140 [Chara braunii]|eukprot:GBG73801.1 hypothetical protein CBR_g17140 [Chara braunii]
MQDMERQSNQANQGYQGNQANLASSSNSVSISQAPGAIVPYQASTNENRENQGYGGYGGNYNNGYGGGYNGGYRRPWNPEQRDRNEQIDKMWSWMSGEMQEKDQLRKEREEATRKEEEAKKVREIEEKRLAEAKDKEDFNASIGQMVDNQMRRVCEEVLGKKVGKGERSLTPATEEIRKRTEAEKKKRYAEEEIRRKDEEIVRLKCEMANIQGTSSHSSMAEQELAALRADNQHFIHDVIYLKEQVDQLKRGAKRTAQAVEEKSPLQEPAKGNAKYQNESTPADYVRLSEAYRKMRDDKDMVEREVQMLKERIGRIRISPLSAKRITPPTVRRKKVAIKSGLPTNLRQQLNSIESPSKTSETGGGEMAQVKFVNLKNEDWESFKRRVCGELCKLKKAKIEKIYDEEKIGYVTIRASAEAIAEMYTDRAYGKQSN